MIRPFRLLATLAATLSLAFGVTYSFVPAKAQGLRRSPPAAEKAGIAQHRPSQGIAAISSDEDDSDYELDKLPILSRVVLYVRENYVDPSRIDPKAMVVSALEAVEKTVAEVMVEGDAKGGTLKLTVGSSTHDLDISKVDSIHMARAVLGEAMAFIQQHLVAHKNLRSIEYAAVNGMLQTLDPHSVLLEPKFFKEMKLQTKGEFGGLGFVIAMRDGNLTVVRVLKNTPAQKAGIRAKDVITKIEEQSTVNMDLQDAVDHLRGKPATRVAITVSRAGWPEAKRFGLVREMINVETIPQAKLLTNGVGYVKLSQFSANTTRDLSAALAQQRAEAGGQLKGLVLDLRGNPGGLLEQAIQVSDLFLSEGVIVKTVGEGDRVRIHEVKEAHADPGDMTGLPMIVLVNNSSASASEIVAGALKNNNRALVVGRQTFGKGSVQVLYDFADPEKPSEDSALKLTIAQYLTPGDISIQEVGVTPDVLLLPGRALKDAVNYFAPPKSMGEADLEHHFSNPSEPGSSEREKRAEERKKRVEKAPLELRYLLDEKEDQVAKAMKAEQKREEARKAHKDLEGDTTELTPEQEEDDETDANQGEFVEDYQIRFAHDLLARAPFPDRPRQLEAARGFVAERRNEEDARLKSRFEQLGVDWSSGPATLTGAARPLVTVTPAPGRRALAGDTVPWTVTVENKGDAPLRRLRAWTLVEKNPLLDRREFIFGSVKPGEKRSWTAPVKVPRSLDSRRDEVTLHFEDEGGRAPPEVATYFDVEEAAHPSFAFSAQIEDDKLGNGDGLLERGEEVTLRVDVKNDGPGPSGDKTYVAVKNLADEKVFIKKGRVVLGAMKPGEVKSAALQVEVKKDLKPDKIALRVMVVDEKLDEYVSEKLEFPVQPKAPTRAAAGVALRVSDEDAVLRAGAAEDAPPIAIAKKGALLPALAKFGEFYKVEWQKGRTAFLHGGAIESGGGHVRRDGSVSEIWQRVPPRITIAPDPGKGAPVVDAERWRIEGSAFVPPPLAPGAGTGLRDIFVFVNEQKVFFKVVPPDGDGAARKMDFAADLPLKPGNNVVTVFAREDDEFQSRRSFVVHRRTSAEVAQGHERQATEQRQ